MNDMNAALDQSTQTEIKWIASIPLLIDLIIIKSLFLLCSAERRVSENDCWKRC
jgi:hypothetical protein